MIFISVRLNSSMRIAYAHKCAVKADASERELAAAERERMMQHKAEVELKLSTAEAALKLGTAEAAKLARGRLIRMVMHDLRSPLLSVANAVSIVQDLEPETCVDHPEVVECHRAMATCSQLMQHIVSDMLDFERIDSGRLVLVHAPMRISQLLQAARDTFGGLATAKGVTLRLVPLAPDLNCAVFFGDLRRLQQCVNNGVSNSVKFTEAGGTVSIRARRGDDAQAQAKPRAGPETKSKSSDPAASCALVVLEVDDSGSGLTADELRVLNLGEAFTQVGLGQMQGSGGTGLGLTIARDLLRLHGGSSLRLASAGPGHGSTFRLELMLDEAPEATQVLSVDSPRLADRFSHAPSLTTSHASGSTTAVAGTEGMSGGSAGGLGAGDRKKQARLSFPPSFRVLHVEDDAILRKTFELRVLKKLGVPFDVAVNGAEAVRFILTEKRKFALVVMDNQMPVLVGAKATRALREGGYGGVIVGMTGDPKGCSERDEFEASGLSFCTDKDTPGIQRVAQLISSFALDDDDEKPGPS
ncbi:histidine kinase-like ATPase [Pavlovales sp. CCMP2436]|nr:histidine kinase-like ATPase [Pavlovales sp. CCMP2436]